MNTPHRVRAALLGQPVDRLPYAFWTHFPLTDLDPDALAEATVDFARELVLMRQPRVQRQAAAHGSTAMSKVLRNSIPCTVSTGS